MFTVGNWQLMRWMLRKGVGANEMIVKEIPQDSVWLDPQTECLVRVTREPNHPGGCPEWVQWTRCNPRNKYFV